MRDCSVEGPRGAKLCGEAAGNGESVGDGGADARPSPAKKVSGIRVIIGTAAHLRGIRPAASLV